MLRGGLNTTLDNHMQLGVTPNGYVGKGIRLYREGQKGGKSHGRGETTARMKHIVTRTEHTVMGMVPYGHGNGIRGS